MLDRELYRQILGIESPRKVERVDLRRAADDNNIVAAEYLNQLPCTPPKPTVLDRPDWNNRNVRLRRQSVVACNRIRALADDRRLYSRLAKPPSYGVLLGS